MLFVAEAQETETVQFSDSVIKINRRGKQQNRDLLVTNSAIYNFLPGKYSKCKRLILISNVSGLLLSKLSDELIIQVTGEHDYHYKVVRRPELYEALSKHYERIVGCQLFTQFIVS